MIPVKMSSIAVSHGRRSVANEVYYKHFLRQGNDVTHLFRDILGLNTRYLADHDENSLTLAVSAATEALKQSGKAGTDIDQIVLSSFFPEYVIPPTAVKIHHAIGGKDSCRCIDVNANCAGMLMALEQWSKILANDPHTQSILLIGVDYLNPFIRHNSPMQYGHFGDAACAVILEKTNEQRGIIDSSFTIDSSGHDNFLFPACGSSRLPQASEEEWRYQERPFKNTIMEPAKKNIEALVQKNGLSLDDIQLFCLSQASLSGVRYFREHLHLNSNTAPFVADQYGYTGTSSPFLVLYESMKQGKCARGDLIMFWTVGGGGQHIAVLFRY